jgi:hypothetical protein
MRTPRRRLPSRWRRLTAALVLAVGGCGCPPAVPLPPAPPELSVPNPSPADQRRAALLSVYYHAWIVDHPRPTVGPTPIDLETAARILVRDPDPQAASRRRRAIVKLAVYGTTCPAHRRAVAILLGPTKDLQTDLEEAVKEAKAQHDLPVAVEQEVDAFLRSRMMTPLDQECRTTYPLTMVRFDPFMGDTWAETRFRVQRPLDAVAVSLDPQNWSHCNAFFRASYVVDETAGPILDQCWSLDGADPPPSKQVPLQGTGWDARLFEHFAFDFAWVEWSWFRNLLHIQATRTDLEYRFRFDLDDALCSRVLLDTAGGGFGIDGGYLEVTPAVGADGWLEVAATKELAFSGRPLMDVYLDYWSPILLWLLGDETAAEACCRP